MEYAQILRALRKQAQLDTTELAKRTEVSRSWIYVIEKGDCSPSISIVKKWVAACKPKGDLTEWYRLTMLLVIDEENNEEFVKEYVEKSLINASIIKDDVKSKSSWTSYLVPKALRKSR